MVLGMDMTISKTTAHKLCETPGGRYAQNPRWPPLKTEKAISWAPTNLTTLCNTSLPMFLGVGNMFLKSVLGFNHISGLFCHLIWLLSYMNVMLDHISSQNSHVG